MNLQVRKNYRKRSLKILIMGPPWIGGTTTVAVSLSEFLAQNQRNEVHYLSTEFPFRMREGIGVKFHKVDLHFYAGSVCPLYMASLAECAAQIVERYEIDLIHAHYSLLFGAAAVLAKQYVDGRVKVVCTFHGTDALGNNLKNPGSCTLERLNRYVIRGADYITAPSRFMMNFVRKKYMQGGEYPHKVIPNFVDTMLFRSNTGFYDRSFIVHSSNFRKVKRVNIIVDAFSMIKKRIPDMRLLLIGDGPERKSVEEYCNKNHIEVEFTGKLKDINIAMYLNKALAFFLTSASENAPISLLEAAACGVPQFATDVGGIPEIVIDGHTGYLFKDDNLLASNIADKFVELYRDPYRWRMMSKASVENIARFTAKRSVKQYEELYEHLISR